MTREPQIETFPGRQAEIAFFVWPNDDARRIVILAHGYGEHLGRYHHVAELLVDRGAVVAGPDHVGHGRSGGERVVVGDFDLVVDDLHAVVERLASAPPARPGGLAGPSLAARTPPPYRRPPATG